tara:strand:- start:4020 stop:4637 length:618 start_codon:yes stop_codon:yes gene_type:complete
MWSVDLIFPLFFYRSDPYPFTNKQIEYIKSYKEKSRVNLGKNYITNSSYVLEDKKLKYMNSFIQKELDNVAYKILKMNKKQRLVVTQSWFNFNPKGSYHHMHNHPNSLLSGTFYIDGEENTFCDIDREYANTVFPYFQLEWDEVNPINTNIHTISNKLHTLTLFPSRLRHEVRLNKNNKERITLAFNCFIRGEIGMKEHRSELKI